MTFRKHRRAIAKRVHVPTAADALRRAWERFKRGKSAPVWVALRVF